jgi:hypothetical protein
MVRLKLTNDRAPANREQLDISYGCQDLTDWKRVSDRASKLVNLGKKGERFRDAKPSPCARQCYNVRHPGSKRPASAPDFGKTPVNHYTGGKWAKVTDADKQVWLHRNEKQNQWGSESQMGKMLDKVYDTNVGSNSDLQKQMRDSSIK